MPFELWAQVKVHREGVCHEARREVRSVPLGFGDVPLGLEKHHELCCNNLYPPPDLVLVQGPEMIEMLGPSASPEVVGRRVARSAKRKDSLQDLSRLGQLQHRELSSLRI